MASSTEMTFGLARRPRSGPVTSLHDDEISAAGSAAKPVDTHDVRVMQLGDGDRLTNESLNQGRLVQQAFAKELHGDLAFQVVVPRLINLPHLARANHTFEQDVLMREKWNAAYLLKLGMDCTSTRRGRLDTIAARAGQFLVDLAIDPRQFRFEAARAAPGSARRTLHALGGHPRPALPGILHR